MRKLHCWTITLLLMTPFVALFAAPTEPVVEVRNLGTELVFIPVIDEYKEIRLEITGPCNYRLRRTAPRDELSFKLDGETTIDGTYRFELTVIPKVSGEIIEVLQWARKHDNNAPVDKLCREGRLPGAPLIQSAGFLVDRARIVFYPEDQEDRSPKSAEGADGSGLDLAGPAGTSEPSLSLRDFVINDDLIVDGSACIGFDCVNGEVFGFDTIRLKENNLRIHFDDTSTAASFPRNDWTIIANDSANGGASKFSIEDRTNSRTPFTVEANARSHSLYVDDGGRIGNRTSTPSVEIHTIDGDTPTLRLQQDGSSGFAPQTWDVAGNETNFFVRDVTNGSALPFRIRPGAPSSSLFIDEDGQIGVGTSSPSESIHIVTGSQNTGRLRFNDGNQWDMGSGSGDTFIVNDNNGDAAEMTVFANGNVTITGTLTTAGSCSIGCDRVFEEADQIESIEEHAEQMWANSHLPAVGPTSESGPFNLSQMTTGMLNELEKAHIYIEQLHASMKQQTTTIELLEARLMALEAANGAQ